MDSSDHTIKKRNHLKSLFRDILEAVSGSEQDFTEGSLSRAILLLSIPAVLEMIMESVFVISDIFFVSRLGADAVATVGITESMVTIILCNCYRTGNCNYLNGFEKNRREAQ